MTQISRPWGGTTVGDAGPYTHLNWTQIWQYFLGSLADADTGILSNILNELLATGVASPVTVNTGVALVNGTFYINDAAEGVLVPIPAGAQRIDRIVLRKDFAAQTVRIHRLVGIEGGVAPALTQDTTYWDMPLFQATVAFPGGAITLVDQRERMNTRIPSMTTAERDAMTAVNGMRIYNETTGTLQIRAGGIWVSYIPTPARLVPPIVRWTMPGWVSLLGANQLVSANRTYYTPIFVPESVSYDRIGIRVGVGDGVGGLADLRIFEWDAGVPGALVLSAGTVSTNAAAAVEIIIAQTLEPGLYFLAVRCDQAPQLVGISSQAAVAPVSGIETTNAIQLLNVVLYDDAAYADPAGPVDGVDDCQFAFPRLREA